LSEATARFIVKAVHSIALFKNFYHLKNYHADYQHSQAFTIFRAYAVNTLIAFAEDINGQGLACQKNPVL
jgi:hypothetical protein